MVNLNGLMTSLHKLASKGDVEGVRKFLKKSAAKVNSTDSDGQTALHCGAKGCVRARPPQEHEEPSQLE